jgi:hypothetical protein
MNDEQQWLRATDPQPMLEWLRHSGKASERRLRLPAVACCRRILHLTAEGRSRRAVEVADRYADGLAGGEELLQARQGAGVALRESPLWGRPDSDADLEAAASSLHPDSWHSARGAAWNAAWHPCFMAQEPRERQRRSIPPATPLPSFADERRAQCVLMRDIFGNPFRAAPRLDPALLAWNGGAAAQLALAAYNERSMPSGHFDPARLAVLADALEEAGAPAALLEHLRSKGPHVRGCAALDVVLGRG